MRNIKSTAAASIYVCLIFMALSCKGNLKADSETLLEVTVMTSGQVTFKGEKLVIRLYNNSEIEADILSDQTEKETKFARKRFSLSESEFQRFKDLLKSLKESDFKAQYPPNDPASDLFSVTKIKFKNSDDRLTEINLEEYHVGVLLGRYGEKYPKALNDLVKYILEIRQQLK